MTEIADGASIQWRIDRGLALVGALRLWCSQDYSASRAWLLARDPRAPGPDQRDIQGQLKDLVRREIGSLPDELAERERA